MKRKFHVRFGGGRLEKDGRCTSPAAYPTYLRVILLNTRNRVIGIEEIYHGSLNSSQVRVGEIFKPAIARMAAAVIIVHNHPSKDCSASPDDIAITRAIVEAGKLIDIECLDRAP